MKKIVEFLAKTGVLAVVFAMFAIPAMGQVPSSNPPYNTDIGALFPSAQRNAVTGTYSSATQTNLDKRGVICTLAQTASSGSPSTTMQIQEFDATTATWFTVKASTAITGYPANALIAATQLAVEPGILITSGPTNSDSMNWPLTRVWRLQTVVASGSGGAGSASTFSVGCNYIGR